MTSRGIRTVIYPVSDLDTAKAVYGVLAGEPYLDAPYYAGYSVDGQDIGLDPNGHAKGLTGPASYWHVPDIHAVIGRLTGSGAQLKEDAHDVGGGKLVATVTDKDGNVIGLVQEAPSET